VTLNLILLAAFVALVIVRGWDLSPAWLEALLPWGPTF
jgi:hypothetical protein